jgi:hypothetical protein
MSYGRGHRLHSRHAARPRRTTDAALVRDIVASLRANPGRRVSDYAQRSELVELVRAAMGKVGHPGEEGEISA